MKRHMTMLLAAAAALLVIAGCAKNHEHPKGEHPAKAEHPEHPTKAAPQPSK